MVVVAHVDDSVAISIIVIGNDAGTSTDTTTTLAAEMGWLGVAAAAAPLNDQISL